MAENSYINEFNQTDKFSDIHELYQRLLPALKTKTDELKRAKIFNITTKNIWDYCVKNIWSKKKDLRLYEMVDNILNIDVLDIITLSRNNN